MIKFYRDVIFKVLINFKGICPGNRLRLIPGMYEDFSFQENTPQVSDVNLLQKQGKRRSWHVLPNKVCYSLDCFEIYNKTIFL